MSVNKAILVGHLGGDPEVRYTASGQAVANFSMATNEVFNDKEGTRQERTTWHRVVAWGRLAEICGEYLTKGKLVYIEGTIQNRSWEDKEGNTRWTTEIVARQMQMLGQDGERSRQTSSGQAPSRNQAPYEKESEDAKAMNFDEESVSTDDDIPF